MGGRCHIVVVRLLLACLFGLLLPATASRAADALQVHWIAEPAAGATLAQMQALPATAWTAAPNAAVNLGYQQRAYWFRVRRPAAADTPPRAYLRIANPLLESVTVHVVQGPDRGAVHALGAGRPFAERPVASTELRLPLALGPQAEAEWWVRVSSRSSLQTEFVFESEATFHRSERALTTLNAVFAGVVLAMALYNLGLLLATRDRTYAWYVCWMLAFGLFSVSLVGAGFDWLWPGMPEWNVMSRPVLLSLAVAAAMAFTRDFIGVAQLHPWADRCLRVLVAAGLAWAAACVVLPYQPAIKGAIVLACFAMPGGLLSALQAWRKGHEVAGHYLLAFVFVVLAGSVLALEKVGLLASSVLTQHATQLGAGIEAVLLSLALAARLNTERRLRLHAERDAARSQAEAGRLADLSLRDALTDIDNRRALEMQLDVLAAPAQRIPLAVMMVDIDHFKRLNDTHGHQAGDACIRAVAQVLRRHARRSHDVAARYGGEEFCLLLPGCGEPEAQRIAESLREAVERLEVPHAGQRLRLTASIGVALRADAVHLTPRTLIAQADRALYAAKAGGRNRVVFSGAADPPAAAGGPERHKAPDSEETGALRG